VGAARKAGVRRFLHQSAIGVRADPGFPYLRSKWMGEMAVQQSGLDWSILRPSIIVGQGDEFLSELKKAILMGPFLPIIGNGRTRFQYIWVEDVARCLAMLLRMPQASGQIIEIGGPQYISYGRTMEMVAETLGRKRIKLHIPVPVMTPIVQMMGLVMRRPPLTIHQLKMLALDNVTALDSVQRTFSFQPRPLSEIIGYLKGKPGG
jgi:NADH dehydrogenase